MPSIETDVKISHGRAMTGRRQRITIEVTQHLHIDQGVMMRLTTLSRRTAGVFGTLGLLSLLLTFPLRAAGAANGHQTSAVPKPTIVLVHGGWADASGWNAGTPRPREDGHNVAGLGERAPAFTA